MPDQYLTGTKSKCMWKKYVNNEIMRVTNSSGIYKAIYQSGSCLCLFEKRK